MLPDAQSAGPATAKKSKGAASVNDRIRAQIARSLQPQLLELLEACTFGKSARVKDMKLDRAVATILVRWPLRLPPPTGNPGDYLGTQKSKKRFRKGLEAYFLEAQVAKRLSDHLYREMIEFTMLFMGIHRFGERTVEDVRRAGEKRLAGRPHADQISKNEAIDIRHLGGAIHKVLSQIRTLIRTSQLKESLLMEKIHRDYDGDANPWMRSFMPALQGLQGRPELRDLKSWSTRKLKVSIIHKECYRGSGKLYALGAINRLM